ncbi:MAG: tetratricopeptide repeat protein [Candidatus Riflebacteria bacterium]|nr:tetratricopeptide repeat protein [Candidatus Riflebacteria bacterium]
MMSLTLLFKLKQRVFLLFLIFLIPGLAIALSEAEMLARLEKNPNEREALVSLSRYYNLPLKWVHTKILADRMVNTDRDDAEYEKRLMLAVNLYENIKLHKDAVKALSDHLKKNPENCNIIKALGRQQYLAGNYSDARYWYDIATRNQPASLDGWYGKMLTLIAMKEYSNAKQTIHAILTRDPGNATATIAMGNIEYQNRRYKSAIKHYSAAYDSPEAILGLGLSFHKTGDLNQAKKYLLLAAEAFPENNEIKEILKSLNKHDEKSVTKQINAGLFDEKNLLKKNLQLADLYEKNGKHLLAADALSKMPNSMNSYDSVVKIADLYAAAKSHLNAAKYYELAAQHSKHPQKENMAAVDSYIDGGNFHKAEVLLRLMQPQDEEISRRLAKVYFATSREEAAIRLFQKSARQYEALAANSNTEYNWLKAADCYLDGKLYSDAERVLSLFKNSSGTELNADDDGIISDKKLSEIIEKKKKLSERNVIKSESLSPELDKRIARLYFETERYEDAISIFSIYPDVAEMQVLKGIAYMKTGRRDNALLSFKQALKVDKYNEDARKGIDYATYFYTYDGQTSSTLIDCGGYQGKRIIDSYALEVHTDSFLGVIKRSHTRVKDKIPGSYNFSEDMLAAKIKYDFRSDVTAQFFILSLRSNDSFCESSKPYGIRVWYKYSPKWTLGFETDSSSYNGISARQYDFSADFHISEKFTLGGGITRTALEGSALRARTPDKVDSYRAGLTFVPERRLKFNLGGWYGERRLYLDSESLYAYNTSDLYEGGWDFKTSFRFAPWVRGYFSYEFAWFLSEWQAAYNESIWERYYEPGQTMNKMSLGLDFLY